VPNLRLKSTVGRRARVNPGQRLDLGRPRPWMKLWASHSTPSALVSCHGEKKGPRTGRGDGVRKDHLEGPRREWTCRGARPPTTDQGPPRGERDTALSMGNFGNPGVGESFLDLAGRLERTRRRGAGPGLERPGDAGTVGQFGIVARNGPARSQWEPGDASNSLCRGRPGMVLDQ